ncbi:MAG: hypothetical protein FJ271_26710 [Planctomycetes bacterium]|nr:hypothetical protein [Planctomycetota bacterium]
MPAPTITVSFPSQGQAIAIPNTANGTYSSATGAGGGPNLSYQINGGPIKAITNFANDQWSLPLTTSDCPYLGQYNMTVYIADPDNSPPAASTYRQFSRSS